MPKKRRSAEPTPIGWRQLQDYSRLLALCADLDRPQRAKPGSVPLTALEADQVRLLLADTARLISREPGNRALMRLPPDAVIDHALAQTVLADCSAALEAFRRAHAVGRPPHHGYWLMHATTRA